MSPSIPDTSKVILPHPFETFCPSTDYSDFEANVIHPAIHVARSRAELSQALDLGCPVFSVPCPSLEETLQFLLKTDYNHPGYKSNKHPDCYV
jgi:hypothetical protein